MVEMLIHGCGDVGVGIEIKTERGLKKDTRIMQAGCTPVLRGVLAYY